MTEPERQSMTLWGRASSVNVQKVLWALSELNIPFAHEVIGGRYGGLDRPDFVALTPIRRIPVLQDGDLALWESHAILRHLARTYGNPIAPAATALPIADQWMEYTTSTLQPPFIGLFWQMVRMTPEQKSQDAMDRHRTAFLAALAPLEDQLSRTEWLAGDRFGIADIAAGSLFYRADDICTPFDDRPGLEQWYARLCQRPSFADTIMTSFEELRV